MSSRVVGVGIKKLQFSDTKYLDDVKNAKENKSKVTLNGIDYYVIDYYVMKTTELFYDLLFVSVTESKEYYDKIIKVLNKRDNYD